MRKEMILSWLILAGLVIAAILVMANGQPEVEEVKAKPITVENTDITETEAFREAVEDALDERLSGDVTVTISGEGMESVCYTGTLDYSYDGDLHLYISADGASSESDWW